MEGKMEETISLKELYDTLKKRILLIISITMLAVAISALISYFMLTPKYQASTQVLVSQAATGSITSMLASGNPFDSDSKYIDTYNVILKSPYILEQVIAEIGLERSHGQLNGQISVAQEGRSQVVTIRVEDSNPILAVEIANITADIFRREIQTLLRIDNIHILSPAEMSKNPTPISPKPNLNMGIAFVLGLMTSVGIVFLLEFLNNTIRNEEDIEKILGLPVLGSIPIIDQHLEQGSTPGSRQERRRGRAAVGS